MANDELITLLKDLQGAGGGRAFGPGLLAQAPSMLEDPAAKTPGVAGVASAALRSAGGGLTLLPVVTGLLKLFGIGGGQEEPPPLEKFEMPAPIRAEAGLSATGESFLIDRGAGDKIRQLPASETTGDNRAAATPAGASITVNVQAMDSQSFMDRREDIARAVREAMLQSHSLNDVVSEL